MSVGASSTELRGLDSAAEVDRSQPVVVWDIAVRLVHWTIALLFIAAWVTHRSNLHWHRLAGYALLTLVLFRLYWGFAGSTTARFAAFVKGPAAIVGYTRSLLRGETAATIIGHNPLGAISVVALLTLLLIQCVVGLFVTDIDGLESGPLSARVSFDTGRLLSEWHERGFHALQVLVAIHVAAVVFYLVARRDNLLTPMVTGHKRASVAGPLHKGGTAHAIVALVVCGILVWAVVQHG